eukprot:TRINITY_DN45_c0_g1_i1.p1 TRINITY_DN45_c0_g1~~TRINITY_DN45_c0_g1_i1.p1  ORF type:complete len:182 (+),score=80.97 TRINITY_DN45_c0_g1_i1:2-547(+)
MTYTHKLVQFFFFSSRRRHTRFLPVSWARRCVQETGVHGDNNQYIEYKQKMNKYLLLIFLVLALAFTGRCQVSDDEVAETPDNFDEPSDEQLLREDFDSFDLNKDGLVDVQELREAIPGITDDEIKEFYSVADTDKSGSVTFEEFVKAHEAYEGSEDEDGTWEPTDDTQFDVDADAQREDM